MQSKSELFSLPNPWMLPTSNRTGNSSRPKTDSVGHIAADPPIQSTISKSPLQPLCLIDPNWIRSNEQRHHNAEFSRFQEELDQQLAEYARQYY
jgi:hypothetical protein